jgi:Zinc binding domain
MIMTNCCAQTPMPLAGPGVIRCARCGGIGRPVSTLTIEHMVKPQFLATAAKSGFRFCGSPDCDVVYFHPDGQQLCKTELRVRVGIKEAEEPAPLCYCFGFTRAMLFQELCTVGHSRIPNVIAAELKAGNCDCEVRNPQGSCCLGNIAAAIKLWQTMHSQTSEITSS